MKYFFSKHILKIITSALIVFLLIWLGILYIENHKIKKQIYLLNTNNVEKINNLESKLIEKDNTISALTGIASSTQEQYNNYRSALPEFIEFTSKNKKIKFLHNKDWICKEINTNSRVDCYPLSRQQEEHDMGLDQPGVYFADLTMFFDYCGSSNQKIDSTPKKAAIKDVGTFYNFKQIFNGCEITVTAQNPEINTEKKLYNIIH